MKLMKLGEEKKSKKKLKKRRRRRKKEQEEEDMRKQIKAKRKYLKQTRR